MSHNLSFSVANLLASAAPAGQISLLWSLPFVLLLGCIALMPFVHRHWWEKNYPIVSALLAAVAAFYYFFIAESPARWLHGMQDYVGFIILLASLFIVSGGIVIHVGRRDTPMMNTVLLLFGAVIANFFGTTGASMLLIRPYLRMNKNHLKPYHVVFFIFIVSNVGGALTPIGDPPLFLGYLKGVPFWWVLEHVRVAWAFTVAILLAVFYVIDRIDHGKRPPRPAEDPGAPVFIHGIHNILFIVMIVWAVFKPGLFEVTTVLNEQGLKPALIGKLVLCREVLMAAAAIGSTLLTSRTIYQHNEFNYAPIREVAILFVGIFSTMVPALQWLNANAAHMPLKTPGQFYFTSGALSSVLDNAPTYLTFLEVELGKLNPARVERAAAEARRMTDSGKLDIDPSLDPVVQQALKAIVEHHPDAVRAGTLTLDEVRVAFLIGNPQLNLYIVAISLGAVFFGACTYIGNGPNFMVKSIADAAGVQTPSFIGYILRYTIPVLLPTYILVWLLFLYR